MRLTIKWLGNEMVKNRNWLALVALIYIQAGNAQITQPYRSNYIKEYMYSCYANQRDNPVNANIEDLHVEISIGIMIA